MQADRDGFWLKSANGNFELKAGGYLQADGRFYVNDTSAQGVDTLLLRRVRPILQGTLYRFIDFRLMPDFGGGKAVLQDAYLELRYFPAAALRAGKFKTPFGLEYLQSDPDMVFVERGLPTDLVPNRDVGIQLSGDLAKDRLNYAIGAFDGTPDGASQDLDTNNGKDLVARLFATPFQPSRAGHPLKGLGFGLAGSNGRQEGALPTFVTAGQLAFFSYATGVSAAGARTRFSPQAYYYYRRFGLLAEFVKSEQKVKKGTGFATVQNKSWQVAASFLLTGENKSFKGVTPLRDFDPAKGGWGAWEISARVEGLTVDPHVYVLGLADPTKTARRSQAWGVGVNWYLNKIARLSLNYEDTSFTGGSAGGNRSPEHALVERFQIAF